MEMYGGFFDVEAKKLGQTSNTFEIKYLDSPQEVFELTLPSLSQYVMSFAFEPYINYLLSRLEEAAEQLQAATKPRIAVAILGFYEFSYEFPLSNGLIDWKKPRYDIPLDSEIDEFFVNNPILRRSLDLIPTLDEIWIFRYKNDFTLCLEHQIQLQS